MLILFIKSTIIHLHDFLPVIYTGTPHGWPILSENILNVSFERTCLFQKDVGCVMYSTQNRWITEVRFKRTVQITKKKKEKRKLISKSELTVQKRKEKEEILEYWYLVSEFVLPLFCSFVNTADHDDSSDVTCPCVIKCKKL